MELVIASQSTPGGLDDWSDPDFDPAFRSLIEARRMGFEHEASEAAS
jgi:hypothetical protein